MRSFRFVRTGATSIRKRRKNDIFGSWRTVENAKDTKEMYANVLKAMAKYNGVDEDEAPDYEF